MILRPSVQAQQISRLAPDPLRLKGGKDFFIFIFYREAETVCPRSGQPVPQGDSSESFARFWG